MRRDQALLQGHMAPSWRLRLDRGFWTLLSEDFCGIWCVLVVWHWERFKFSSARCRRCAQKEAENCTFHTVHRRPPMNEHLPASSPLPAIYCWSRGLRGRHVLRDKTQDLETSPSSLVTVLQSWYKITQLKSKFPSWEWAPVSVQWALQVLFHVPPIPKLHKVICPIAHSNIWIPLHKTLHCPGPALPSEPGRLSTGSDSRWRCPGSRQS